MVCYIRVELKIFMAKVVTRAFVATILVLITAVLSTYTFVIQEVKIDGVKVVGLNSGVLDAVFGAEPKQVSRHQPSFPGKVISQRPANYVAGSFPRLKMLHRCEKGHLNY